MRSSRSAGLAACKVEACNDADAGPANALRADAAIGAGFFGDRCGRRSAAVTASIAAPNIALIIYFHQFLHMQTVASQNQNACIAAA